MGSLGLFLQCATSTFFSLVMSHLVRHFGSRWVYMSSMVSFTVSALVICLSKSVVLVTAMAALTGYAYATLQTLPYTLTCHYHKEKEVNIEVITLYTRKVCSEISVIVNYFVVSFQVYMPKRKTKSVHKNGITSKRDSVFLTPVEEENGLNHKTGGGTYGHAFLTNDNFEYYPSPHSQNGSSHSSGGTEQEEAESGYEKRGVGLDFAILDSTFLLSQVFPTLFMGMIVQFAQSVTTYIAFSAIFGAVAIYLARHIVFDQKDLKS